MEISIRELAKQLKLGEETLLSIAQNIGIENSFIDDSNIIMLFAYIINEKQNFYNSELKDKELKLKQFHEKDLLYKGYTVQNISYLLRN